ncbi:MAG: RNase H family protein [Bacilli bacterium]
MKKLEIYCDGSCYNKIGKGGIGIFIPLLNFQLSIGLKNTSSDRAEIIALIHSLDAIRFQEFDHAIFYIDNQYVVNTIEKGWLVNWIRNKEFDTRKNIDLWLTVKSFIDGYKKKGKQITLKWIKGHSKKEGFNTKCNHVADMLADYKQKFELTIIDNVKFE